MQADTRLLSPAAPDVEESVKEAIIDFWRDLYASGDARCTNWEALGSLQDCVTECLAHGRLQEASEKTAKAFCLIQGLTE